MDFVEKQERSPRKIMRIAFFSVASIFIAIFCVLATVPLAFIHGEQILPSLTFPYNLSSGFPFGWFVITYDAVYSNTITDYVIGTMEIDELILMLDFILYAFMIFIILVTIDFVSKKNIIRKWKRQL